MKVVTYNILANVYAKPERYPGVDFLFLEENYRKQRLGEQLIALDADILCLQEVEFGINAHLEELLKPQGYKSIWAKKGMGRPEGVSTFFRKKELSFHGAETHYFRDQHHQGQFPSGHAALILYVEWRGKRLGVLNTHIRWDEPTKGGLDHVGNRQVIELAEIVRTGTKAEEWIVCGDFNAEEEAELMQPLFQAGLIDVFKVGKEPTINLEGIGRVDYILHSPGLKAWPLPIQKIDEMTLLPSKEHPSDHAIVSADFV